MNSVLLLFIAIPIIEIFVMIKVGGIIGALNTILLILFTAITGIYYAKYEGLNTLRSGLTQLIRNEVPFYEIISGATIAFAALLLILPGFITDFVGLLLIIPITRKIIIQGILKKKLKKNKKENYVDADFEEIKIKDETKDE